MLQSKAVMWIVAGLAAVALSATTILAAPQSPLSESSSGQHRGPGWDITKPVVGQMASTEVGETPTPTPTPTPANEDEIDDLDEEQDDLDEVENSESVEEKIVAAIADHFGLSQDEVENLRTENKLGNGELHRLCSLARAAIEADGEFVTGITANTPISEAVGVILDMRLNQSGWGNVAKELGLKPGNRGDNLGAIISGRVTPTSTITGTITGTVSSLSGNGDESKDKDRVNQKTKDGTKEVGKKGSKKD